MSKQVLIIDSADLTATSFTDVYGLNDGRFEGLIGLENYFGALCGGNQSATVTALIGAVQSDGYLVVATGGSTNDQTMTLCNVTLTAKTSASLANEFTISATAATQAANMVAAINASSSFTGKVVASQSTTHVVLTAVVAGAAGNGLQLSAGNLSNVTVGGAFANGSDGTSYSY